jgi:hypothetical protein
MKKGMNVLLLALTLWDSTWNSAGAVTDSELDGERHPYVGLMVAQDGDGNPLWRCSGTLISATIFLTAGHCLEDPAHHVEIWLDSDVESQIPGNGYPYMGETAGSPYTHPDYDPDAFYLHDLGVVVLDEPVPMDEYGALPERNELDRLGAERGEQDLVLTAVGYGLPQSFSDSVSWKENNQRVRMLARPHLIEINTEFTGDFSLLLSNNANTGDTCFGDSGGPNFIGETNVVAGVTLFDMNGNCFGTGGVYRLDRADDLNWLATFGLTP